MRHAAMTALALCGVVVLSGCSRDPDAEAARALQSIDVIDQTNMTEIMLTVADPAEAVTYFRNASAQHPDRLDLRRGLARSLVRAGRASEAIPVWRAVVEAAGSTNEDRVMLAEAQIRTNAWDDARATLDLIPPTHETFDRYRLEAMVADARQDWARADSHYETAVGLTTRPAGVLNNWGYSRLTRGQHTEAEALFRQALTYDPNLFTAKNNLVLARAAQRRYEMPVIAMTQIERAQLLHTMALGAIRMNDVAIGEALLQEAIDTHPQHFDEAVRALRALQGNVRRG
jgi:Flp pilus assembly protein TadD